MPSTNTRIVGSGFSAFHFMGVPIAFLDDITDSGQQPITQYQAVTPLGASYPVEFATPRVRQEGTIQMTIRELWNQPVWWALGQNPSKYTAANGSFSTPAVLEGQGAGLFGPGNTAGVGSGPSGAAVNIVDVYNTMAASANPIYASTVITLPSGGYRGWVYSNFTITQIDDREQIQIGSLTMPRTIQGVYSYKTYFSGTQLPATA